MKEVWRYPLTKCNKGKLVFLGWPMFQVDHHFLRRSTKQTFPATFQLRWGTVQRALYKSFLPLIRTLLKLLRLLKICPRQLLSLLNSPMAVLPRSQNIRKHNLVTMRYLKSGYCFPFPMLILSFISEPFASKAILPESCTVCLYESVSQSLLCLLETAYWRFTTHCLANYGLLQYSMCL